MTTELQLVQKSLYDRDFSKWLETTADQLRAKYTIAQVLDRDFWPN